MRSRPSVVALAFFVLLVNSGYLYAFADPTMFYFANVALHVVLGIALIVAFAAILVRRRDWPPLFALASLCLMVGGALGLYLTIYGATRAYRWALLPHIVAS